LVKGGHEMSLLTFEPGEADELAVRDSLAADGIEWHWLRYHMRPSVPATLFDIANAVRFIQKLMKKRRFDILHARSHVPMMMAALARNSSSHKPKLLFDIRGFMPEEYVDAGVWPDGGAIYRNVKRAESWLMKQADGFVVLTERAREILADQIGKRPVEVIPCCVDLKRFETANEDSRRDIRAKLGIGDRYAIAYVGAFGGWYLTLETADFLAAAKKKYPDLFTLILTQSDPEVIRSLLRERGFGENDFFVGRVASAEIPKYLSAADTALSFIKNCYSKQASSPTKNAEYLACGLPIIANTGIGDTDRQISEDGSGILIHDLTDSGYKNAVEAISSFGSDTPEICKAAARTRFDLVDVGGVRYRRMYDSLASEGAVSR
ncbi:MAG: glycosyltransferase family 4 protein, partial [bacterium]|nr:glycosyltransferase family 4 protein [bacterium]